MILRGLLVALAWYSAIAVGTTANAPEDAPLPSLRAVDNPNICLPAAGSRGWCGDGGLAGQARLAGPRDIAPLVGGGYLVADTLNHVVRRVDGRGIITTIAGIAARGSSGDGGPATQARLDSPTGVAVLDDGFVVADPAARVVRYVGADGTIRRLAGTGRAGASGDGGLAVQATLRAPRAVAVLDDNSVLIADATARRVRRVMPNGTISTFAGTGTAGTAGDGGPATGASLREPTYVSREPGGSVLIADRGAARIRRVAADGTISTVAGGEIAGTPATALRLEFPSSVTSTRDGGFLVAEATLVRQVYADGTTKVVAGTGALGFNGDGSLAVRTLLTLPSAVSWLDGGEALIADASNDRIRRFNLLGGIRTIAGFDRPDQVVGAPSVGPGTGALVVRRAADSRPMSCSERSRAGTYNVLRIRPSDSISVPRRASVTLFVESSSAATVKLTVRPRGSGTRSRRFRVAPGRKAVRLRRLRAKGSYRIRVVGIIPQIGKASRRCAERVLRVR